MGSRDKDALMMKTLGFKMSLQMIIPGEDDGVLIVEDPQSSDATAVHGFFQ